MKDKICPMILIISVVGLLSVSLGRCQNETQAVIESTEKKFEDTLWVWGEATKIDTTLGQITIKYLDYDTDEEKEIILIVDPTAVFENVSGLKDIQIGDYASVDYILSKESKNIAKNISIERPEKPSGETPIVETIPEQITPETAPTESKNP